MDTLNIEQDSTFKVKSSLVSMKGIQLEASNSLNSYVVNDLGKVKLLEHDGSTTFEEKATWIPILAECTY
jgi:hypothetical protein